MSKYLTLFTLFLVILAGLPQAWSGEPAAQPSEPGAKENYNEPSRPDYHFLKFPTDTYPRWEGGRSTDPNDPRDKVFLERDKRDPAWQGKMPIDFYGKVLDTDGLPVEGATIEFCWTDLSPDGTSKAMTQSDVKGLFSLRNAKGKNLGMEVKKEGYYTCRPDRYGYEFASYSDDDFYQPDPANPVVFHLRKKGQPEPMIHCKKEAKIAIGSASELTLYTGVKFKIELLSNSKAGQGPWQMRVSVSDGGLQPATQEFSFFAPNDGYQSSVILDHNTPKPPAWDMYEGGTFYLKTGSTYAKLKIETIAGRDWVDFELWLNPSGSQNLEFDPAKVIRRK